MAAALAAPSGDSEETAERVCKAVFAAMTYENGATTVSTTAAAALALGRGVCQDYAYVMLALCHVLRLPARYVSGHLLGQGGTHAWTEVIVPRDGQAEAVAFDRAMAAAPTAAMSPSPPAATTPTSPPPPAPTSAPPRAASPPSAASASCPPPDPAPGMRTTGNCMTSSQCRTTSEAFM